MARQLNFLTVAEDTHKSYNRRRRNVRRYNRAVSSGNYSKAASLAKSANANYADRKKKSVAGTRKTSNQGSPHSENKVYRSADNHKSASSVSKGVKDVQYKQLKKYSENTVAGRAATGVARGLLLQDTVAVKNKKLKNSIAFKAGNAVGDLASYGLGYGAAGKMAAKTGAKLAAGKLGKKAVAKVAATKTADKLAKTSLKQAGRTLTKKAIKEQATKHAEKAVKLAAKNVVADATAGTALNTVRAKQNGVKNGKDYAKYMATNAGLNLVAGGAIDTAPILKKLVKVKKADTKITPKLITTTKTSKSGKITTKTKLKNVKTSKLDEQYALEKNLHHVNSKSTLKDAKRVNDVLSQGGNKTVKEAVNDKDFVKAVRNSGISVSKMAEASGKSKADTVAGLYHAYKGKGDLKVTKAKSYRQATNDRLNRLVSKSVDNAQGSQKAIDVGNTAKGTNTHSELKGGGKLLNYDDTLNRMYKPKDENRVAAVSTHTQAEQKTFKTKVSEAIHSFKTKWLDEQEDIYQLAKKTNNPNLLAKANAIRSASSRAEQAISGEGIWGYNSNGELVKKTRSLKEIFSPIVKKGDDYYADFQTYAYSLHNIDRMRQGKPVFGESVTTRDSIKTAKALLEAHPEFKELGQEIVEYNRSLKDILVDSGLTTKEASEVMDKMYPNYVPTHRVMTSNGSGTNIIGSKINVTSGIKTAKGSNLDLKPLHEQMINNTRSVTKASLINDFGLELAKTLEGSTYVRSIDKVDAGKLIDDIGEGIGENNNGMILDTLQANKDGTYTFNIKQNGNNYALEIDKNMFDAIVSFDKKPMDLRILSKANSVFRDLVTSYNPLFMVRNGLRDYPDAFIFTKQKKPDFCKNYAKAWKCITSNSEEWQMYKAIGGEGASFFDISKQWEQGNWFKRKIGDRIEAVNQAVEQAPRLAEFIGGIEKYGNNKEGIARALEDANELTVNFARGGSWGKVINRNGGTFFNAGVQELVRLSRSTGKERIIPILYGATIMGIAPSVINELLCGDMESYQDLRQNDKDINFYIPIGDDKYIKIPKGRFASAIGMAFQRTTRNAMGNTNNDTFKGMGESLANQIAPVNPVTNNLLVPATAAFGKTGGKTWYGTDIVPTALQRLPKGEQTDENTTALATKLGEKLNISPKKIDYVLKQYSGVLGQVGMPLMTPAAKGNIIYTNFITDAVTNNEVSTKYYNQLNTLSEKSNSKYATVADKVTYKYFNKATTKLSAYNDKISAIQTSDLSRSEKLSQIREIRKKQTAIEKEYMNKLPEYKNNIKSVLKSLDRNSYSSDDKYMQDVKRQASIKTLGADATLQEELGSSSEGKKKYKEIIKSGLNATNYYKAYAETQKYDNFYAKAVAAVSNGVKTYNQAKAINGRFYQSTFEKAKRLQGMGFTAEQINALSSKSTKKKIDASGNGYLSTAEIVSYLNRKGYSQEKKRKLFTMYAPSNWRNPF